MLLRIYVYPGSFDPVTNGHLDIIERASRLCDKLVVAVLVNGNKNPAFTLEERVDLLNRAIAGRKNVEVISFDGLLINLAKREGALTIIKGLRAVSDFEYEMQMAHLNKIQDNEIETLFMMTSVNYSFLSSSSVREIAKLGGSINDLVPECVKDDIFKKFGRRQGE